MEFNNKNDIINLLHENTGFSKASSEKFLNSFINIVSDGLSKGKGTRLVGFGEFLVRHRKARKGRNPQNGEPLQIAARDVPAFKAGTGLKNKVNNK